MIPPSPGAPTRLFEAPPPFRASKIFLQGFATLFILMRGRGAFYFSHQTEGGSGCSYFLPAMMKKSPLFFPLLSWSQPLSRSLWFLPLPFLGAGCVLGVLGNGCAPTALSRPRLSHRPLAACGSVLRPDGRQEGTLGQFRPPTACYSLYPRARLQQGQRTSG